MAITPDVMTITVDGVVIGLSETVGDLIDSGDFTPENLAPYMFCGNNTIGTTRYGSLSGSQKIYSGSSASQGLWFPVVCTTRYGDVTVEYALNDDIALENQCYGRNILVYGASPTPEIHSGNTLSTQRVVTSVDFHKLYYDVELAADTVSSSRPAAETKTYYKSGAAGKVRTITNDVDTSIYVYDIFVDEILNEWYCILDYHFPGSDTANHQWKMCPTQKIDGNYGAIEDTLYDGWSSFALTRAHWRWGPPAAYAVYGGENQSWDGAFEAFVDLGGDTVSYCDYDPYRAYCTCYVCGLDNALKQVANAGLRFKYNNTWYKPLGEGGVITGYTDDMTDTSDWDDISDVTGNTVPVTPPGPVPPTPPGDDDDNTDPINYAGAPYASGLCHYYAMTAGSVLLEHISEALGVWDIEHTYKDLYKNLVSCKLIKPPGPIPTDGSDDFTIYGVKPLYQGNPITLPVVSGNPTAKFGPYSISRKFNDFRDFSPYTRVEIYLPYCGWTTLPSHVVGRSVTVQYYTDIIAATCKAIVSCNNNVIAEAAGVIGLDIPFAADNVGAKMQAVTAGLIATGTGGIQLAAGVGSMVSTKSSTGAKSAVSGLAQYLSGYTQTAMAFNENTTEITGKNGDGCCLSGATNILIKVTRPKYGDSSASPFVPAGFAKTVGFLSHKYVRVSNVSGYLLADNVNTSGISGATDAERAEIKRVLETTGIYVNSPPE